tara:strand:- start:61 stop:303 length:243 start_codon:yes stop_codon:yes gene_type:complete
MINDKSKNMEDLEKQLVLTMKFIVWQIENEGKFGDVPMITYKDDTYSILDKLSDQLEIVKKIQSKDEKPKPFKRDLKVVK